MNEMNTNRLKLRLIESSDLNAIHALHSLPSTDEYNTLGIPENIEVTREIINNWIASHSKESFESYIFAISLKEEDKLFGLISLKNYKPQYRSAELWYKTHSDYWGKGYATEAVNELIRFGFKELNLHRIEAGCAVDNVGSIRVLEKTGFKLEGRKKLVLPLKTGWSDAFEYAILEDESNSYLKNAGIVGL